MNKGERGIVFTNDLDGVHFVAPLPVGTTYKLLSRKYRVPEPGRPVGEHRVSIGAAALLSAWSVLFHRLRPFQKEALAGLILFHTLAHEHNRSLQSVALSGREKDKHAMTIRRLQSSAYGAYFTGYHLNPGRYASAWKETVVRNFVNQGHNVVHIDDDINPGLCIARIGEDYPGEPRVLVYMRRNLSNNPLLLRWGGVQIPSNLVFVKSFREAAHDFGHRLEAGSI